MFPLLHTASYNNEVYRNIFTCTPSQNLLDDICESEDEMLVDAFAQATSGIDHDIPQKKRVFQYGTLEMDEVVAVFKKERWGIGRFGDGLTYGVWYSAEDEITSVYEAAWTCYQLAVDNVLAHQEVYTSDRVMYAGSILTDKMCDLLPQENFHSLLTQNDYVFCQSLGKRVVEQNIHMIRTPSARRSSGVCTPIFASEVIREITFLYYLNFHVLPQGNIHIVSARSDMNITLQAEQLRV